MDFQGKTVVVTGASRGIGRSIARAFAEKGANVALISRSEESLEKVAQELERYAGESVIYAQDVRHGDKAKETLQEIREKFGQVDVLVNNAGIARDNLILRLSEEDWREVMEVNLKSVFLWSKEASKIMLRQKSGSIINMSSVIGMVGNAGQSNYAASKAGIIGFTKSLAKELATRQIRVNAIAPGFIETEMTENISESMLEKVRDNIPMARFGKAEEVASTCLFLASPMASYITGTVIQIDGGLFI